MEKAWMSHWKGRLILTVLFLLLCFSGAEKASAATTNVVSLAKTVSGGSWAKGKSGMFYRYADGSWAKSVWLKIDGKIYCFNAKGVCQTGWISYGGNRYYADLDNGLYISRFRTVKKIKCYFLSDGTLAVKRWVKINGKYYYFLSTGRMCVRTMITVNGKTYYVDASGARVCGMWVVQSGKRYYFNSSGVMKKNCWLKISGKYYYVGSDGAMVTDTCIDGYYVGTDGARLTDCVIGDYYYDETGKKSVQVFRGKYLFLGDSRTVGMSNSISDSDAKFIGKVGAGYSYLIGTGGSTLKAYLNANPDVTVFLCLGVNDPDNISLYIAAYRQLILSYPDTRFYIVAVNPVNESLEKENGYSMTNALIEKLNAKLKAAFPDSFLDSYTFLTETGFLTQDGLHYLSETYQDLYRYLISQV